jgi:hypothetical protein
MQTPWGKSDHKHVYAPGIVFYGTPGHGGIKVSKHVLAVMPPQYVNRSGWYEEDCEVTKVILAFPHLFPEGAQRDAAASFARWFNPDGTSKRLGVA